MKAFILVGIRGGAEMDNRLEDQPGGAAAPPSSTAAPIQCSVATDSERLRSAFGLIYKTYLREGLVRSNRFGLRILPHQLLDTSWVLLAVMNRRLVGTLSVIEDGRLGLPIESLYPAELATLRSQGRRVAELTCLATERLQASEYFPVLRELLWAAIQLTTRRRVDCLTICVHPRYARFYRQRLSFADLGPLRRCSWVCDGPAVAMSRDLDRTGGAPSISAWPICGSAACSLDLNASAAGRQVRDFYWSLLGEVSPIEWPERRAAAA
jgi:N-acyl amino acid synthase FeeM